MNWSNFGGLRYIEFQEYPNAPVTGDGNAQPTLSEKISKIKHSSPRARLSAFVCVVVIIAQIISVLLVIWVYLVVRKGWLKALLHSLSHYLTLTCRSTHTHTAKWLAKYFTVNTTQEHLIDLIGPFPSWWKIVSRETNDKASLFLSFHSLPPSLSLFSFSFNLPPFLTSPSFHLYLSQFSYLLSALFLSVLVHIFVLVKSFWITYILIFAQTTESTHSDSLTHVRNEVHWCLSTEWKVFLSIFSSHLMLRKSFHTWESLLTGTHTHACVWIIHTSEKWCRVTRVILLLNTLDS